MKINFSTSKLVVIGVLFLCVAAVACKPAENTVVIEDAPVPSEQPDTTITPQQPADNFQQLDVGLIHPIATLDPLFAQNVSALQMVQLLYEGLIALNEEGQMVPALAKEWSVSADSLTYRFTLRDDIYYHDSNIFSNGRGRRLVADDVKFVFERMAQASVPSTAARLFMTIRGFEPYFQEQHHVLLPAKRQLKGVIGIQVPNDTTVIFSLNQPDAHFLQKLASPYAVIYPREAVESNHFTPVGTGPFSLSQHRTDSLYILAQFDNYYQADLPKINRIDIHTSSDETALLQALQQGDIQLIPTLGPLQVEVVTNASGQLSNTFVNQFRLFNTGGSHRYIMYYNEGAATPKASVIAALKGAREIPFGAEWPSGSTQIRWDLSREVTATPADTLTAVFTSDPFVRSFYTALDQQLEQKGIHFQMQTIRTSTRNTALATLPHFNFTNEPDTLLKHQPLASFHVSQMALADKRLEDLAFNQYAWWIDLRSVAIAPTDNN